MATVSFSCALQNWLAIVVSSSLALCESPASPSAPPKAGSPPPPPAAQSARVVERDPGEPHPANPALQNAAKTPQKDRAGQADLDPQNDPVVGPPDAVVDCEKKLKALGLEFTMSELPFRDAHEGFPRCGASDAVVVKKTATGISIRPPALVSCHLAVALSDLDSLIQELSEKHLHDKVVRLDQAGTYSCRKMKRFDLVSEHSYGNALDVLSFTLKSGRKITVLKDFGPLAQPPATPEAAFLRSVGEQAYDRNMVSVSLGPYWDALHKDHFHFDLARYRVDGSRPR